MKDIGNNAGNCDKTLVKGLLSQRSEKCKHHASSLDNVGSPAIEVLRTLVLLVARKHIRRKWIGVTNSGGRGTPSANLVLSKMLPRSSAKGWGVR